MRKTRLDWVTVSSRDPVSLDEMHQHSSVAHYSIPNFDARGGAVFEPPGSIESAKLRVLGEELLVSRLNPRKPRVVTTDPHEGLAVCSSEFVVLKARPEISPRFLYWWLLSNDVTQHLSARVRSVTRSQQRVAPDVIRKLWIDLPQQEQQQTVASYLDAETSRIENLIDEQETLIGYLTERRASELDGWIEHGGNVSALRPLDSRWLDAVPTNWELMPLKRAVQRVMVGIVINPSAYYEEEGVPVLRGLNVRPGSVNADDLVYMSDHSNLLHAKSILREGDVVVVRTGLAGAAAQVPSWAVGGNAVDLLIVRPGREMLPAYVELLLNSRLVQRQVVYGSVGALQAHFNTSSLSNVSVTVPPLEEQRRVVDHLGAALERYDRLMTEAQGQVALLGERRQALITHAVTHGIEGLPGVA